MVSPSTTPTTSATGAAGSQTEQTLGTGTDIGTEATGELGPEVGDAALQPVTEAATEAAQTAAESGVEMASEVGSEAGAEAGSQVASEGMTLVADAAAETAEIVMGVIDAVVEVVAWVLCSELARQGKLESSIVDQEWEYIKCLITYDEYTGYRIIADPLVKLMQKSRIFTWAIAPLIRAFAYEMASRVNPEIQGNKLGTVILAVGLPMCRFANWIKNNNSVEVQHG